MTRLLLSRRVLYVTTSIIAIFAVVQLLIGNVFIGGWLLVLCLITMVLERARRR
jgi:hypothetical protein